MANSLDAATLVSIAKHRSRLLRLAEGIKTRKKSVTTKKSHNLKLDPAYTNIEHLVFGTYRPRSSTPAPEDRATRCDDHSGMTTGSVPVERAHPHTESTQEPCHPHNPRVSCECAQHSPPPCADGASVSGDARPVTSRQGDIARNDRRPTPFVHEEKSVTEGGSESEPPKFVTSKDSNRHQLLSSTKDGRDRLLLPEARENETWPYSPYASEIIVVDPCWRSERIPLHVPCDYVTPCDCDAAQKTTGNERICRPCRANMATDGGLPPDTRDSELTGWRAPPSAEDTNFILFENVGKMVVETLPRGSNVDQSESMVPSATSDGTCPDRCEDMGLDIHDVTSTLVFKEDDSCCGHSFNIVTGGYTEQTDVHETHEDQICDKLAPSGVMANCHEQTYGVSKKGSEDSDTLRTYEKHSSQCCDVVPSGSTTISNFITSHPSDHTSNSKVLAPCFRQSGRDEDSEHPTGRRASSGVAPSAKVERQHAFRRQNTYPSSIPKPKVYPKPTNQDSKEGVGKHSPKDAKSDGGAEQLSSFRKTASLSEKMCRAKAVNMPVIQNLSLQKMKGKFGEKSDGLQPCRSVTLPTKRSVSLENKAKESTPVTVCSRQNGIHQKNANTAHTTSDGTVRNLIKGNGCSRTLYALNSKPSAFSGSNSGARTSLASTSKSRSTSRSSLTGSRSSLGGSRNNLVASKVDPKQSTTTVLPIRKPTVTHHNNNSERLSKKDTSSADKKLDAPLESALKEIRNNFSEFSARTGPLPPRGGVTEYGMQDGDARRNQRITSRLPMSKSYGNLLQAKTKMSYDEKSGVPNYSGKNPQLFRQSSVGNIPLNATNGSSLVNGRHGVNKTSPNSLIPTRCTDWRLVRSTSPSNGNRALEGNSSSLHAQDYDGNGSSRCDSPIGQVQNYDGIVYPTSNTISESNSVAAKINAEDFEFREDRVLAWSRSLLADTERSTCELDDVSRPRKFSLDDKLREWYSTISDGDTFDPHAFEQWALRHLELCSPPLRTEDDVKPSDCSSITPKEPDKIEGTLIDLDTTSPELCDSKDVDPCDLKNDSFVDKSPFPPVESKTLQAIERLVREQTIATTELCKSWMSDIEEKDENSSSGASRAPSEEPPETTGNHSPRRNLQEIPIHEEGDNTSGLSTHPSRKLDARSESLGLERLLPVGPSVRRGVVDDTNAESPERRRSIGHHSERHLGKVGGWRLLVEEENRKFNLEQKDPSKADTTRCKEKGPLNRDSPENSNKEEKPATSGNQQDGSSNVLTEKATPSPPSAKMPLSNSDPPRIIHPRHSSLKLLRNRPISRSERQLKATSTPEFGSSVTSSDNRPSRDLRRPWSHVYSEADNASGLLRRSSPASGSLPSFGRMRSDVDGSQTFLSTDNEPSLRTSGPRNSVSDSMLQKFRKSFSLRFHRSFHGKPDNNRPGGGASSANAPKCQSESSNGSESSCSDKSPPQKGDVLPKKDNAMTNQDNGVFRLGPIILRSSKDRKKMKRLRSEGSTAGESKCNSADSGIHIELICPNSEEATSENNSSGESPAVVRRRAASASEPTSWRRPSLRPLSDSGGSHSLAEALEWSGIHQRDRDQSHGEAKRTLSDTGSSELLQRLRKTPSIERQISTPPPIKLRSERSKPHLKRRKGRTKLRRSISHPVDLEKLGVASHKFSDLRHGGGMSDRETSVDGSTASSEDDLSSDGESRGHPFCSPTRVPFPDAYDEAVTYGEALWDHVTVDPEELAFKAGEVIEVTDSSDRDWWWGSVGDRSGWFPATFVRLRVNQEETVEDCITKMADGTLTKQMNKKMSISLLSNEQVRANVVREIVSTERDFVQHLKDVVEGYLQQVRRHPDMFSEERISTIFGNVEQIYHFQSEFLDQLEAAIDWEQPHLSEIGNCFLQHEASFEIYSEYCNNHPLAVSELQELYSDAKYLHFFEACRLLREMIDISLDGFLLTPVQKICKYPLQLAELLKYTKTDHPDYEPVRDALAAMRHVAQLVNERKRRMECLEQIAEWQRNVDAWEGLNVLDTSSMLLHSGDVVRVTSTWSRELALFLFDHVLIYCKKVYDFLKRPHTVYKGRINLDSCHVYDIDDGKDLQFGVNVRNCWKMYCTKRDKWYLFYTKTADEKQRWLQAFQEERQRVQDDAAQGFTVTEQAKKAARLAVLNRLKPKRSRAKFPKGAKPHPDTAIVTILLDAPTPKSRAGSLPSNLNPRLAVAIGERRARPISKKKGSGWFHFGSGKKPKK